MSDRLPQVLARISHGAEAIDLDLLVLPDLLWFRGHFPGTPVLPGVVQLHWALHYARECLGLDIPAARDFQIKFKAVIAPEDRLLLALARDVGRGRLSFEYRRGEQVCSSGRIRLP